MYTSQYGFTFIECLIAFTIILVIAFFGMPGYKAFLDKTNAQVLGAQLLRAINLARSEAIMRNEPITLCQSADLKTCQGKLKTNFIILSENKVLHTFQNNKVNGVLNWRAFPINRDFLRFLPSGFSQNENGTFWYCPKQAKHPAWAIMISRSGRARIVYFDRGEKVKLENVMRC